MSSRPFDLKSALAGSPVVTRRGKPVTGLRFVPDLVEDGYPLVGLLGTSEKPCTWTSTGLFTRASQDSSLDLFMESTSEARLRLNPEVLQSLRRGDVFFGGRHIGKTTTLLTFIATTWPTLYGEPPIIVTGREAHAMWIRDLWRRLFPGFAEPRFMSERQFEGADGFSGFVFTDEHTLSDRARRRLCYRLRFGGGVQSV